MNLIGLGLGPIVTGLLSDALNEHLLTRGANADEASADGLRFSMLTMLAANLFSAIFYWRAARTFREESIS